MTVTQTKIDQARRKVEALQAEAQQAQDEYTARLGAIQSNPELSQVGKNKAIKALLTEQRQKIDGLVTKLRRAAVEEAAEADTSKGVRELLKREYSNWDYGRLAYEANRVRSAFVLAGGDDFEKIAEAWQQVKARGDKYEVKAWMDTAPAIMPAAPEMHKYATETRQSIIEDIAASEMFTLTEEGREWETMRAAHVENLEAIAQAAAVVSQSLSQLGTFGRGSNGEVYQAGSMSPRPNQVIPRVFDGIALDRKSGELHIDRQPGETAEQMYSRTEAAYQEKAKALQEFAERFNGGPRQWLQGEAAEAEKFDTLINGVG